MQGSVESLGTLLRREREQQHVSLRDISAATKIQLKFLEAIERDEFERLPPAPFAAGFLRAYAQCIGLEPEEVVGAYYALHGGEQHRREHRLFGADQAQHSRRLRHIGLAILGVAVLVVVGIMWYLPLSGDEAGSSGASARVAGSRPSHSGADVAGEAGAVSPSSTASPVSLPELSPAVTAPVGARERPEASGGEVSTAAEEAGAPATLQVAAVPSERSGAERPAARPADTEGSPASAVPDGAAGQPLEAMPPTAAPAADQSAAVPDAAERPDPLYVEVEAVTDTWLEVVIDGETRRPFTLEAGRRERWQAAERVEFLTIGNVAGTRVRLNGREISLPQPRSNVARNIVLTRDR